MPAVPGEHFPVVAHEQRPHLGRQGRIEPSDAAFGPDGGAAILQNLDRVFSLLTLAHQVVATAFAVVGLKEAISSLPK